MIVSSHSLFRDIEKVTDGRRSFPSGHSSAAWAGMTFLSLYLAGVTGAWCLHRVAPARYLSSSRLTRLCLTLAPIAFATWVAVSRLEDYVSLRVSIIHAVPLTLYIEAASQGRCDRWEPHWYLHCCNMLPRLLAQPLQAAGYRPRSRSRKTKKCLRRT